MIHLLLHVEKIIRDLLLLGHTLLSLLLDGADGELRLGLLLQVQARLLLKLETKLLIRVGRIQRMVGVSGIRELLEVKACVFLQ